VTVAADDSFRICLLAVDVQNTFCIPGYELFVAGRSGGEPLMTTAA
jgi:nicotinamidase-related amidase